MIYLISDGILFIILRVAHLLYILEYLGILYKILP